MKNLRTAVVCIGIMLSGVYTNAQNTEVVPVNEPNYNKPKLFTNLPDQIPVNLTTFDNLFNNNIGTSVDANFSDAAAFRITGQLVASVSKFQNSLLNIAVRSSNYNGAILSASKYTDKNGQVHYTARLFSKQHGDGYVLTEENGRLLFVKKDYNEIVME
jgi:hypothetical protein